MVRLIFYVIGNNVGNCELKSLRLCAPLLIPRWTQTKSLTLIWSCTKCSWVMLVMVPRCNPPKCRLTMLENQWKKTLESSNFLYIRKGDRDIFFFYHASTTLTPIDSQLPTHKINSKIWNNCKLPKRNLLPWCTWMVKISPMPWIGKKG